MVFYIIGLGLGDELDITLKGLQAIKSCEYIYLESYTSILGVQKDKLEALYGKKITEADRETCEEAIDEILAQAKSNEDKNVAFLVVGDPFCATTHMDLFLRAVKKGLKVEIIHNASIINAAGCSGMQVYRFGEVVSLPFFTENWKPFSFYDKIEHNFKANLHTLLLLDIKVKERSVENLLKGKKIYEPPRFMEIKTAVEQLIETEKAQGKNIINSKTKGIGLGRVGMKDQLIVAGYLEDFLQISMGPPLHSFIICAPELHIIEQEMFEFYSWKK